MAAGARGARGIPTVFSWRRQPLQGLGPEVHPAPRMGGTSSRDAPDGVIFGGMILGDHPSMIARIRRASRSTGKGFVTICIPGARNPAMAAFSA